MLTAITRGISPAIVDCELMFVPRQPIDVTRAAQQHQEYEQSLVDLGVEVVSLAIDPDMPDAVFVEDAAIVLDEVAIVTRMGAKTRAGETASVAAALSPYRRIESLTAPATLDGGDVMQVDGSLFVGMSARTNQEGIAQLREIVRPLGYDVKAVQLNGCLHLKTGCTYLGRNTLLINPAWVDARQFDGLELIAVPPLEPFAANTLKVGNRTLVAKSFPITKQLLVKKDFAVWAVDISELQKAEAGLTCMSLIFEQASTNNGCSKR